jgi:uncharacterized membrane protein YhaH (DUF805 family)
MTNFADVWSRKSDEQVQDAAGHLTEYSAEAQVAILSEALRRGLNLDQTVTVDHTVTATPSSATVVECYLRGWKRGIDFRGRAGRKEYFTFLIPNGLILVGGLIAVSSVWRNDVFAFLVLGFFLAIQLPNRALMVRRIHDTGRVGWWALVGLIPFVGGLALLGLFLQNGEPGPNRWGDPT